VFWAPEAGQVTFSIQLASDSFFEEIPNLNRKFEILNIAHAIPKLVFWVPEAGQQPSPMETIQLASRLIF